MKHVIILLSLSLFVACATKKQTPAKDTRCYQKPDPGMCRAYMPSYYYDSTSNTCKEFIYGGCGGSRPFTTLEDCQKSCGCDNQKK